MAKLHENLAHVSFLALLQVFASFVAAQDTIRFFPFLLTTIISHNMLCHCSTALVHYRHMCHGSDLCMLTCLVSICVTTQYWFICIYF